MKILTTIFKKIKRFLVIRIKTILYLNPVLYIYYFRYLRLPFPINKYIKKIFPIIDPFIIFRKPKLKFNNKKILIDELYKEDSEYRQDLSPYKDFFDVLDDTFDLNKINSILDIGCSTGHLINFIKNNYPHILVNGIEYFQYHKNSASEVIQNDILINDIRNPLNLDKYDIVICTEVAEHIEPYALNNFILNLRKATKLYLLMTWSNSYPDFYGPPQHVSSLKYKDYLKLMKSFGFIENTTLTDNFINSSKTKVNFNYWWRESLVIFTI